MNDNCYSTAIRHYIDRKNANGESYQSKISSVGHDVAEPTKQLVTLEQLDRAVLVPNTPAAAEIKSTETSLRRSYSEQRMGPPHEHPSLAGALHEYRVPPAVQKKSPPVLLSTAGNNHVFFKSDNKIACEPPPLGIAEMV
jgi:hypothetical protein